MEVVEEQKMKRCKNIQTQKIFSQFVKYQKVKTRRRGKELNKNYLHYLKESTIIDIEIKKERPRGDNKY